MPRGGKSANKDQKTKLSESGFAGSLDPNAIFYQNTIVAVADQNATDNVQVAMLTENAFEDKDEVQATIMNKEGDTFNSRVYGHGDSGKVKINLIIEELAVKEQKSKGRGKKATGKYEITVSDITGLETKAKQLLKSEEATKSTKAPALQKSSKKVDDDEKKPKKGKSTKADDKKKKEKKPAKKTKKRLIVGHEEDDDEPVEIDQVPDDDDDEKDEEDDEEEEEAHAGEDEEVEEEEEEEEEKTTRSTRSKKKITGKKAPKEEEEEEEEPTPSKKGRGRPKKESAAKGKKGAKGKKKAEEEEMQDEEEEDEEEDKKASKKKKTSAKKGKATKKEALDEEEEEEEAPKKPKRKTKPKKLPTEYKKGKYNPAVEVIEKQQSLEGDEKDIVKYGSFQANNRNLIRAVKTKNHKLLEKALASQRVLSNFHQRWGPENDYTALELAVKMGDSKAITMILESNRTYCASEPQVALKNVDTGYCSKAAFGVQIRKVNLMRGGREGNNAFAADMKQNFYPDYDKVFDQPLTRDVIDTLRVKVGDHDVMSRIHHVVLRGDREMAGYLVQLANKNGGYGFNYLHEEVLTKNSVDELTKDIKRVSVTKKPLGNAVITPLHCAAINPNHEILDHLLKICPEHAIPDQNMRKPIHYAACCDGTGPLKFLIEIGADPNESDQNGLTPFMYACYYGRAKNVKILLEKGNIKPDAKTKDGMMGIHWAAQRGHLNVIKVLAEAKVKLNVKGGKFKMTPMHFAAAMNHFEMVEYLHENKGKINIKDKLKRLPLTLAVRNGNLKVASYLLKWGSDIDLPDSSNNYPMHYAAAYGFPECIDILKKAGCDINATNLSKCTPLTIAMLKNNFNCVKALLEYPEVDVNAKDDEGRTLVSLLCNDLTQENFESIQFLKEKRDCDINLPDLQGMTPLHHICAKAKRVPSHWSSQQEKDDIEEQNRLKLEIIRYLISKGADYNKKNNQQLPPLYFAINQYDRDAIDILLQQKDIDLMFKDQQKNNILRLIYTQVTNEQNYELVYQILDINKPTGKNAELINEVKDKVQNTGYGYNNNYGGGFNSFGNRNQGGLFGGGGGGYNNRYNRGYNSRYKQRAYSDDDDEEDDDDNDEDEEEEEEENSDAGAVSPKKNDDNGAMEDEKDEKKKKKVVEEPDSDDDNNIASNAHQDARHTHKSILNCFKNRFFCKQLTNYLQKEENAEKEAKRQKLIDDFNNGTLNNQNNMNTGGYGNMGGNNLGGGGGGLFGNNYNNKNQNFGSGGLFGNNNNRGSGLFGANRNSYSNNNNNNPKYWNQSQIKLTAQETRAYQTRAHNAFDTEVRREMELMQRLCDEGGQLPNRKRTVGSSVYYNDPRFLKWLLANHEVDMNKRDKFGNTFLYSLIGKRRQLPMTPGAKQDMVNFFVSQGLPKNKVDKFSDFRIFLQLYSQYGADFLVVNKKQVGPALHLIRDSDFANLGFFDDLIEYQCDIHYADKKGITPFLEALIQKDEFIMNRLVELKVNVNQKDKKGRIPLMVCLENEYLAQFDNLLKNGGDYEIQDSKGRTAVHYAVIHSRRAELKKLAQKGASLDRPDFKGCSPLYFATKKNDTEMIRTLISESCDVNRQGSAGLTPLHLAVRNKNIEQVELFLTLGGDVNKRDDNGRNSLMIAVQVEELAISELLIKKGAEVNARDVRNRIPLHYAVNNSKPEMMFELEDLLLRNGADINAVDCLNRTPLHYAFTRIDKNSAFHNQVDPVESVSSLCNTKDIQLEVADHRGRMPIHYAAEGGAYICILLLMKKIEKLDEADADGNTPLGLSLTTGHKDTAAIFIEKKAVVTNMIYSIDKYNLLKIDPLYLTEKQEEIRLRKLGMERRELNAKKEEEKKDGMALEFVKEHIRPPPEDEDEKKEEEEEDDDDRSQYDFDDEEQFDEPEEDMEDEEDKEATRLAEGIKKVPTDSFFAKSIRSGWQGVAYLLLQGGFSLMEATKDALNENQFRYVIALMTKINDEEIRKTDYNNQNLFHVFASKGHRAPQDITTKIFDGFWKRKVEYKAIDNFGRTPLHYASENNFSFLENRLLESGVDPNILDKKGMNMLHLAVIRNNISQARLGYIMRFKLDINTPFEYRENKINVLHYVAHYSHHKRLEEAMLQHGADPNFEDSEGYTPFTRVYQRNQLSMDRFQLYTRHGVDLNRKFKVTTMEKENEDDPDEEPKPVTRTYTPLHWAVHKNWTHFMEALLSNGCDASLTNDEGYPAFHTAVMNKQHISDRGLRLFALCGLPINAPLKCEIRGEEVEVPPLIYYLSRKDKMDNKLLEAFLECGADVNLGDQDGQTPLIYAIKNNYEDQADLILQVPSLKSDLKDNRGRTPIHHLVNPLEYGSYENVSLLNKLAKKFDVNAKDKKGKPPIFYAHFQDSGVMLKALLALGATDDKSAQGIQRQATSMIADVEWPEEVDYEHDAEQYVEEQVKQSMANPTDSDKTPVDHCFSAVKSSEVVTDDDNEPYSLFMTKVDIKKGDYGEYLFYRMQVIHEKNRDNYLLFNRWGRIGEDGMHQETPYPSKEECIKEFCKIFKDKSGNDWADRASFKKVEKKYQLYLTTKKNKNDCLKPIDWDDKKHPKCKLDKDIRTLVRTIADVKLYHRWFGKFNIDSQYLPFGRLTKTLLNEAKKLLLDIKHAQDELKEKTKVYTDIDYDGIFKLKELIADKSSRFYELIPDNRFKNSPIRPIDNETTLSEKVETVNSLLNFEVSSKILLGSLYRMKEKHPLEYCFESLNVRVLPLTKESGEYQVIKKYVKRGYPGYNKDFIINVFALERKGEAERISQWKNMKNRMYLWHGSKISNYMGILSEGLRIAPPEAPATGYMFGKGIYLADTFQKSYNYTYDWSADRQAGNFRLMMLCETALGDMYERFDAEYVTSLDPPYKSTKGLGRQGPDFNENVTLVNGAVVPLGKHKTYEYQDALGKKIYPTLNYNEYIVYDLSQVRIRYLIQVK